MPTLERHAEIGDLFTTLRRTVEKRIRHTQALVSMAMQSRNADAAVNRELEIDLTARKFEVLRGTLGRMDVDASLKFRGRFEQPKVTGDITVESSDLKVDEILERTLFQPYATEPTDLTQVDAVAALNPWDRLLLDFTLHVPNTLKLTGKNVQISQGTPLGFGDFNLRVLGDLYIYKDPGQPVSVTGSLDRVSGTYSFQGRRFTVSETESSINCHRDLRFPVTGRSSRRCRGAGARAGARGPARAPGHSGRRPGRRPP